MRWLVIFGGVVFALVNGTTCSGQEPEATDDASVTAGHSYHGEAFNEGPRQQAYLMEGLGRSRFPISTSVPEAQAFFNQGIDQLHGFWYFEAERSFRQVVVLDPECAMAYWGLAMANVNNDDRAKEFVRTAQEKSLDKERETTNLEKRYIEALSALYDESVDEEKQRAENFANKLEELVLEFPDDTEAKAFLACQLWMNQRKKLPITCHVAVNALLDQVFEVDPMHPAHHYRIHLWDYKDPKVALHSAASCGPSLPDVAHMWHMPGHIYSKLKRYEDAVWQQEASARVDHHHMMRDQVLPDQIHNFAHNNEWCIRNLNHVGRVRDAIDLATNMISMPRHPKYNHLDNRGSTWYGRQRLFDTLSRYELWEELIEACHSSVLDPTDNDLEQFKRLRYLGRACYRSGDTEAGDEVLSQLQNRLSELKEKKQKVEAEARDRTSKETDQKKQFAPFISAWMPRIVQQDFLRNLQGEIRRDHRQRMEEAVQKAVKETESRINVCQRAIEEMEGHQFLAENEFQKALGKFKKAGEVDAIFRATVLHRSGKSDRAIKDARKYVERHENEVQPLANLCWLLWQAERKEEAKESFQQLSQLSNSIDMQSPVFERLNEVAEYCGADADWHRPDEAGQKVADDLGERPDLDSLGPFRWQPIEANGWELVDSTGQKISLKRYQGEPVIVIFYLGHGCLHCAEQLQTFAPMLEEYREAGIEMVAISTDPREQLKNSIESYGDQPLPIQLVANPEFDVFKSYRVFDEFENQPLHGTFLIDGDGKIRWQDISYEPFMDPEFLLKESTRLLSQD